MNKRFEVRKARFTPVVVSHDEWPWPEVLVASDASPRGLFITSDRPVKYGEYLRLSFRLGTDELWEPEGVVVHSTRRRRLTDVRYSGIGVDFLDVSPFERSKIRELLRKHPPPVPMSCIRRRSDSLGARRKPGRGGGRRRDDPQPLWVRWGKRRSILTELK